MIIVLFILKHKQLAIDENEDKLIRERDDEGRRSVTHVSVGEINFEE